jgi:hypothetical protein
MVDESTRGYIVDQILQGCQRSQRAFNATQEENSTVGQFSTNYNYTSCQDGLPECDNQVLTALFWLQRLPSCGSNVPPVVAPTALLFLHQRFCSPASNWFPHSPLFLQLPRSSHIRISPDISLLSALHNHV